MAFRFKFFSVTSISPFDKTTGVRNFCKVIKKTKNLKKKQSWHMQPTPLMTYEMFESAWDNFNKFIPLRPKT